MNAFGFHAAPPPGEWLNDPNGLAFDGLTYRLFAQHSRATPDFKAIGWAAFSSVDLLCWRFDGVAIPPSHNVSAFSGCVTKAVPLEAFLTLNDTSGPAPRQSQFRAQGEALTITGPALGPEGRNVRDPFVFWCSATNDWRMLIAEPCDWTDWETTPQSSVGVWRSADKEDWRPAGRIGPWDPPGIMWEVPLLLDIDGGQMLILSKVDRRGGGASCSVEAIVGRFDGHGFMTEDSAQPIDLGPDFYAACANTVDGWPDDTRVVVGWASSWATARAFAWPGEVNGGVISLPRVVHLNDRRVSVTPLPAALPLAEWRGHWRPGEALALIIEGDAALLAFTIERDGVVAASRSGVQPDGWSLEHPVILSHATDLTIFIDAGLIEIFFGGRALTAFVGGAHSVTEDRDYVG